MTRSELAITWVVSAFPLIFVLVFLGTKLHELTGPLWSLGFLAVYYFKVWVVSDRETIEKRRERWSKPITKRQGVLMLLALPAAILFLLALDWLNRMVGKGPIIGALIAVMGALWIKDCVDAWTKYRAARA